MIIQIGGTKESNHYYFVNLLEEKLREKTDKKIKSYSYNTAARDIAEIMFNQDNPDRDKLVLFREFVMRHFDKDYFVRDLEEQINAFDNHDIHIVSDLLFFRESEYFADKYKTINIKVEQKTLDEINPEELEREAKNANINFDYVAPIISDALGLTEQLAENIADRVIESL